MSPVFVESAVSGMETSAYLFCSILSTILLSRIKDTTIRHVALTTFILLIWTISRPEALVLAPISIIYFLYFYRKISQYKVILITFACLLICWLLWRLSYFGHIAPNTYFAKKSANRINEIKDGFNFIKAHIPYSLGCLFIIQSLIVISSSLIENLWTDKNQQIKCLHSCLMFIICLLGIIFSGGDSYLHSTRFFLVAMGFATYATCLVISDVNNKRLISVIVMLIVCNFLSDSISCFKSYQNKDKINFLFRYQKIAEGTKCEKKLAQHLLVKFPNAKIGQEDFERLKYFEDQLNVIDLHGLNDVEIAHSEVVEHVTWGKFNYSWPIKKNIDLWFPGPGFASKNDLSAKKINEIFDSTNSLSKFFGLNEELTNKDDYLNNFSIGTIQTCKTYYNFIIRKSLIEGEFYKAILD